MPGDRDFFFDTYALVERQNGNPAYEPYAAVPIVTHQLNLLEFIAAILRAADEPRARRELSLLNANTLDADTDDLFAAAQFRLDHPGKRISYADALGYSLAQRHGLRFLTGDKRFKGIEGVEHVP